MLLPLSPACFTQSANAQRKPGRLLERLSEQQRRDLGGAIQADFLQFSFFGEKFSGEQDLGPRVRRKTLEARIGRVRVDIAEVTHRTGSNGGVEGKWRQTSEKGGQRLGRVEDGGGEECLDARAIRRQEIARKVGGESRRGSRAEGEGEEDDEGEARGR